MRIQRSSRPRLARIIGSLIASALAVMLVLPASAQEPGPDGSNLLIPDGPATTTIDQSLAQASGEVQVIVRLGDAPLIKAVGSNARQRGAQLSRQQQVQYVAQLANAQDALIAQITSLGGREIARLQKSLNAIVIAIDASELSGIAALPNVRAIRPVVDYELDLSEVVPYVGATAVQNLGVDGSGVKVAVLDSGIDYTHFNLGGPGTLAAYEAAYGTSPSDVRNKTRDGLFPTAKVVDGYDFVGEQWPNGPLLPDPDPIDFEGHGTHVADIIGGRSNDGTHKGVAPGVNLYAVKVCSAISSSCNGVALLQGIEFSLDPNGDNDISDAVDVINMSLGSPYGQREDDLSEASANAVRAGVVVVSSAGNSADRPYILGSPSSTPEVISVAQTQVPSAQTFPLRINTPANIAVEYPNTATVDWAPIGSGFTGDVVYVGQGCNADQYLANPAGKVALVDRGACNISEKTRRASDAGAIGVLVGLIAPGDAVGFSNGGQCPVVPNGICKPTLIIIQSYAALIKARLSAGSNVNVTVSPDFAIDLIGSVVGSSSRGPNYSYNQIKPDIAAPGASVSAEVGTGTGETPFSGTSGAAPVVAGAAALLVGAFPDRIPAEIKSLLMNTAETEIYTNRLADPSPLAPITLIGGGEVRVDRALASTTAAWGEEEEAGSVSYGYVPATGKVVLNRKVVIRNYSNVERTYTITPRFRYEDDAVSGAVVPDAPKTVKVKPNGSKSFTLRLTIDASKLPIWMLNGGAQGGNGSLLQSVEFDGYVEIADAQDSIHVAWHVLPHRAANVKVSTKTLQLNGKTTGTLKLANSGGGIDGRVDVFSLTGTSPQINKKELPGPGDNYAIIDLRSVGVRQAGSAVQFAINTWGERTHPAYPAEFDVYIDTNRDGADDYVIYSAELSGLGVTGQTVVNVGNLSTGQATAYFYIDADLNSANAILTAPMAALGLTLDTKFDFSVYAFDNYFTGSLTDAITGMTYTLGKPRFLAPLEAVVPPNSTVNLTVTRNAANDGASPSQTGLLLMYRDAKPKAEAEAVIVKP